MNRRNIWRRLRRRRWWVLAAALATAVALFFLLRPARPERREGSVEIEDRRVEVGSRVPRAYRIVYRTEVHTSDDVIPSTEELVVRRPFEARVEERLGAPPGRGRPELSVHAFARLRSGRAVFAVAPVPAPADRRPDAFVADAVRSGFAEAREVRRVAGRPCRVYRMHGEPGRPLERLDRDARDYTEQCFDGSGLLLEEITVTEGDVVTRKVAIDVSERPRLSDDAFETGNPTLPVRSGGGSVQRVKEGSRTPGEFWELDRRPPGFVHRGRYAVIPPQTGFEDPVERGRIITFMSDVWVDGVDVIVVEQGATLSGSPPFARAPGANDVRVGDLGRGQLVYTSSMHEVRVLLEHGRFVRVLGTVPAARLLEVARKLEKVEGGELEVVGGL